MLKTILLGASLTIAAVADARASIPLQIYTGDSAVTTVGEGCGANRWRDRNGYCHYFGGPGGVARGTRFECPPGTHVGPQGGRCWPNR